LQLPHPLRLDGQIATDFNYLSFNGIRRSGGSPAALSSPRRTSHVGLRHGRILTVRDAHVCTVWNAEQK
jgi:hypothetical protein